MTFSIAPSYLAGTSIGEFEREFRRRFPDMAPALWLDRPGCDAVLGPMFEHPNEFESNEGGRGDSYRRAHQQGTVKAVGVKQLLELATGRTTAGGLAPDYRLLDVLGGDGTVTRAARGLPRWNTSRHWILTGDLSAQMVQQAMAYGLPALRLAAQFLLCRDDVFQAVLIAYGSHHIPQHERVASYRDALRVLRPGGRLVVHDFAIGSPTANWFETVVAPYSRNGHAYTHFTPFELRRDMAAARFHRVDVKTIYDPIVVHAPDESRARQRILSYLLDSYGLACNEDTERERGDVLGWVDELVAGCIRYESDELEALGDVVSPAVRRSGTLSVFETPDGWVGELPRTALVGIGTKDETCA